MNNRVVHFEIQAEDIQRAIEFYTEVFGWEFKQWGEQEYWVIMTAPMGSTEPGINGGLLPRPKAAPGTGGANAYVCTVQVDDFDSAAAKILASGGTVAMEKFDLGGMAWQGYFVDTEGNTFGLHQVKVDLNKVATGEIVV